MGENSSLTLCPSRAVTGTSDPDQALERRDVHFRLDPPNMGVLTEGHIDYVNLANDHTRDFRTTGLRDTMTHLEALGIAHTGAGRKSKAGRGIVIQRGDVKYGFMSFSDHPREWAAFDKVRRAAGTSLATAAALTAQKLILPATPLGSGL